MSEENVHRNINDAPDSLEIGTPAKGGSVKIYGNFGNLPDFKLKIDAAKEIREYAQRQILGEVV